MTGPSLLSSVHGPIRRVLVTVPYWVLRYREQEEIAPYGRAYEALLASLPEEAERVVATHEESADAALRWLEGMGLHGRSRVVTVPDGLTFTLWAQDACLVRVGPGDEHRLVVPAAFPRHDDAEVLDRVARSLGLPLEREDLRFQGGNVLVGDDFWLLGADAVLQTLLDGRCADEVEAVERFAAALEPGRRLVLVGTDLEVPGSTSRPVPASGEGGGPQWDEHVHTGNPEGTRQPLFDLDTFVSLAGRDDDGAYRLLVGDPRMAADLTSGGLPDHAVADVFDDVAGQLSRAGFRVLRNPLPLVSHDDRVLRRRTWYFASSNNVITEIDGDARTVWIPTYAQEDYPELERTDAANARLWRGLGFEVRPLPSFHLFARGLGAAHCACKCLGR